MKFKAKPIDKEVFNTHILNYIHNNNYNKHLHRDITIIIVNVVNNVTDWATIDSNLLTKEDLEAHLLLHLVHKKTDEGIQRSIFKRIAEASAHDKKHNNNYYNLIATVLANEAKGYLRDKYNNTLIKRDREHTAYNMYLDRRDINKEAEDIINNIDESL